MHISKIQIENYKSFLDSEEIELTSGFNVIIGQNDAGKTALCEALSLQIPDKPHRSLKTAPQPFTQLGRPASIVTSQFEFSTQELLQLLYDTMPEFYLPTSLQLSYIDQERMFQQILSKPSQHIMVKAQSNEILSAHLVGFNEGTHEGQGYRFKVPMPGAMPSLVTPANIMSGEERSFPLYLAKSVLRPRIYLFRAERLNVGDATLSNNPTLMPDAANLPSVLHLMMSSNPFRSKRFNDYVNLVFPHIRRITVPLNNDSTRAIINIWSSDPDPDSERQDLATRLSECGTGIGQVLAILYVLVTAEVPRIIIIDEPQSFLHPGAIRKLLEILRRDFPQHQYIIATHSSVALTSAEPRTLIQVRKEGAESKLKAINMAETEELMSVLRDVGARLSDVFGVDSVLWVEGSTEEKCFPMILSRLSTQKFMGTQVLGVINTGDLRGKHKERVLQIYQKLSGGNWLLPPAIGFIFDREDLTSSEIEDIRRRTRVNAGIPDVHFTIRKLYVNYLLHPEALAARMNEIEGFCETPTTPDKVKAWINGHAWEKEYIAESAKRSDDCLESTEWLSEVHGARLLDDLFRHFSENHFIYVKTDDGVKLTEWILRNAPNKLEEIAHQIEVILSVQVA